MEHPNQSQPNPGARPPESPCIWSTTIRLTNGRCLPSFSELSDAVGYCCVHEYLNWSPIMHSPPCTRKNLESFVDIRCTESVVAMCWGHSPPRICKSSTANNCALNKANDRKGNPDLLSARNSLSKSLILRELSRETCRTFSNGTTASSNFPYKSLAESQISIHPSLQFHTHTLNSTLLMKPSTRN